VDLSTQWAVAALPKQPGRTGKLVFLADESGAVFVTPVETFRSRYPLHPGTEGWVAVSTSADLRAYQARLRYTLVSK
jgi:hypothetical protein